MSIVETAATRMIPALSALLHRPLSMVDGQSAEASHAFAVRMTAPRLAVVSADGTPFSEAERRVLAELFEILRAADESESKFQELERRMTDVQRENLELTVRNRMLSDVSSRDSLTGLYNRWYVIEKIDAEINRTLRHGSPMAIVMLDIDHFKQINDTYGHGVGDHVLQWVAQTLRESCRVYDIPGRYGGEEFCVVLPETPMETTPLVAERIRSRLASAALEIAGSEVNVTASFGIAGVDSAAEQPLSPAALLERADRALYTAKHLGRNRVELWGGSRPRTPEAGIPGH
jgi:diguanylate cyclase (GGDEF)-like protein